MIFWLALMPSLKYDNVVDREALKSALVGWKAFAFLLLLCLFMLFAWMTVDPDLSWSGGDIVARVTIDDVISDDRVYTDVLNKIKFDKRFKALLIKVDSPGGSAGASESLYRQLSGVGHEKPVVVVMGSVAASGGYLISLAGDHIIANSTTLTGSIGVLLRFFNVSELVKKVGVSAIEIKSSDLKAEPSPFHSLSEASRKSWKEVIDDTHDYFTTVVAERRNLSKESVLRIADGRVYTGAQALSLGLIDAIGGEEEALQWVKDNHSNITNPILKDIKIKKSRSLLSFVGRESMSAILDFVTSYLYI